MINSISLEKDRYDKLMPVIAGTDMKVITGDSIPRAHIWTTGLEVGGGNWRLPAVKEIQTLYDKGKGTRNMSPLLNITGWSVWSKEDADSGIANVNRRLSYYFRGRGRVQDQGDLNPCRPA